MERRRLFGGIPAAVQDRFEAHGNVVVQIIIILLVVVLPVCGLRSEKIPRGVSVQAETVRQTSGKRLDLEAPDAQPIGWPSAINTFDGRIFFERQIQLCRHSVAY